MKLLHRILVAIIAASCLTMAGCGFFPESTFELASESRLPKWFALPPGLSRSDVTVTMSYYTNASGRTLTFTLRDADKKKIAEVNGTVKGGEPLKLKNQRPGFPDGYPNYEIVTVNGEIEFIEHRKMEPVFYITDDPAVRAELGRLVF